MEPTTTENTEPNIVELSQILQDAHATVENREAAGLNTCIDCGNAYQAEKPAAGLQCPDCFEKAVLASPLAKHYTAYKNLRRK